VLCDYGSEAETCSPSKPLEAGIPDCRPSLPAIKSGETKAVLAETYAGINPAAVQRQIQALTAELLTLTTSKAGPGPKAAVKTTATRASADESTNQTMRAS